MAAAGLRRGRDLYDLPWRLTRGAWGPEYDAAAIIGALNSLGMKKGSTFMVHSSWADFRHYSGTSLSLVAALMDFIGTGTLLMPAFPADQNPSNMFDVRTTPASGAGLVAEVFRRHSGVRRSISLNHSVCAWGSEADYLTSEHHLGVTSFDEYSPFYRLAELDGWVVTLGLGRWFGLGTVMHCAEAVLRTEMPLFADVWAAPVTYRYRDFEGREGEHTFLPRSSRPWSHTRVESLLRPRPFRRGHISSLRLQVTRARDLRDQMIALGRRGISCYY